MDKKRKVLPYYLQFSTDHYKESQLALFLDNES